MRRSNIFFVTNQRIVSAIVQCFRFFLARDVVEDVSFLSRAYARPTDARMTDFFQCSEHLHLGTSLIGHFRIQRMLRFSVASRDFVSRCCP
mmetsp:Transcript_84853/g.226402  ORF Transcript_84853/g.226402 Transcript_84853/m.226402 type:complete len:91 (+) Transcript_84853:309-581(+)